MAVASREIWLTSLQQQWDTQTNWRRTRGQLSLSSGPCPLGRGHGRSLRGLRSCHSSELAFSSALGSSVQAPPAQVFVRGDSNPVTQRAAPRGHGKPCAPTPPSPRPAWQVPSVCVPVAVHVALTRAAGGGALEHVLVHGQDCKRRGVSTARRQESARRRQLPSTGTLHLEPWSGAVPVPKSQPSQGMPPTPPAPPPWGRNKLSLATPSCAV